MTDPPGDTPGPPGSQSLRSRPDEAPDERWKSVQPLPNWRRKETRQGLLQPPSRRSASPSSSCSPPARPWPCSERCGPTARRRPPARSAASSRWRWSACRASTRPTPGTPRRSWSSTSSSTPWSATPASCSRSRAWPAPSRPTPTSSASPSTSPRVCASTTTTPITAADVKFTLERIARKGSDSPLVTQLEAVSGFAAYNTAGTAPGLAGIETPDPATVVVRLDRPFSSFPSVLGHPGFGIVSKAAVERLGDAFKQTPVGSGPFRRVESDERPDHAPSGRRASTLGPGRRYRLRRLQGRRRGLRRLAGRVDRRLARPARPGQTDAARSYGRQGMSPYNGLVFYGLNLKSPDLADPRFREAISLAIDRRQIVDEVYQGSVALATGLVADGVPRRDGDACGERCRSDPDRSRQLLVEAFPAGEHPRGGHRPRRRPDPGGGGRASSKPSSTPSASRP